MRYGGRIRKKCAEKKAHSVKAMYSVRTKLIVIMIILMGLTFFLLWLMNYTLLTPYYEGRKITLLEDSFQSVSKVLEQDAEFKEQGNLTAESQLKLEILNQNRSINLYVFSVSNIFGQLWYVFQYPNLNEVEKQTIQDLAKNYLYGVGETDDTSDSESNSKNKRTLIQEKDEYTVFKAYDRRIGSYYLELFGQISSGSYIYLRTNYQSMSDNIVIFNHFMLYAGAVILLLGVLLMVYFGNSFAKPIMQIADIAKKMSELDFNVKYPVQSHDEVGVLGSSINMLSETLESTISELKTANNELQKDIEKKTQIDEMRKEFLSNVSHELKTPIALIQGYAEGLLDNISEDKESRDFYCEVIIDEAKKMNKMVQKLLTLNQIEFGNNELSFERFDIVSLVENVMNSARLLAEQKEASMFMHEAYGPVYVWADEYMTEEVVTNYISNAINHVDGEKKIEVFINKMGKNVRVSVRNTGKCIPEDELDKIWIKFYKVDKARTRAYGGSGIGLSIVKAVMESMHHECGARNIEDGVEFWFELDCQNQQFLKIDLSD